MIDDMKVGKLETLVLEAKAKPDQRRRWTMKVIERMRVAERAARILIWRGVKCKTEGHFQEIWDDAVQQAITELRQEGMIR